jgi:two-component system, OmpR family, sensor histidine kinase KdpD
MNDDTGRPDPDKLLELVRKDASQTGRGRLKIFFGAAAGVGKTYSMLSEARRLHGEGRDVIIGVIEHHGRVETKNRTEGLPVLPLLEIDHRGVRLKEFDLDAALVRKPSLILMDEFAHTNAPGSRHPKRWQDVEELLSHGIDVYTTLNVQHLESLNDVVAKLTGIWVNETVPDKVFDAADEIELIDIPSDDLLKRLAEGKVYVAEGANKRAAENFFKKTTLGALRELALRRTAERVDAQNDLLNAAMGLNEGQIGFKILVLVGHDPLSEKLVRQAKLMADRAKAPWYALYIQTDRHERLNEKARLAVEDHLRLAEKLGAQIVRLSGAYAATEILAYARTCGFTRIVVGHRRVPVWHRGWRPALSEKLIERGSGIEITVISDDQASKAVPATQAPFRTVFSKPLDYVMAVLVVAVCTLAGAPFRGYTPSTNLAMIYLTGVVFVAARLGRGPSILASVLSIPAFNFFFTEPYFTFNFYETYYYVTFAFMLITSLLVGSLTARLSLNAKLAQKGEQETQVLYSLTRGLSAVRGFEAMTDVAASRLSDPYKVDLAIWVKTPHGFDLYPKSFSEPDLKETSAVQWVQLNGQIAGLHTDTMPSAKGLYLPLIAENETLGVLGLTPRQKSRRFTGAELQIFETFASLIAGALQRARRADEAAQSRVESENERLRNVLLASLSHDLRTPLTVISGQVSNLLKLRKQLPREAVDELTSLWAHMGRLQKFVANLLKMAAITSGSLKLNFEPYLIQEIIGAAISRVEPQKGARQIRTSVTGQIPMVMIDGALIEQVVINLLENAISHTQIDGTITIGIEKDADLVRVRVSDNGDGIRPGSEEQIFERFHSDQIEPADRRSGGTGLGLAICRGIIQAHGGLIFAKNNPTGTRGASFIFTLPVAKEPG